ncbi:MAG: hypothetical protein ABR586_03080 [Thermoplasmatota archaeon]
MNTMRTVLFATFALLLAVPAHALPAAPDPALSGAASQVLEAAVQDAHQTAGKPEAKSIPQAIAAHAYLSALGLIAEWTANRQQDQFWEAAQASPSPPDAFMQSVFNVGKQAHTTLEGALSRLANATEPQVGAATAARLAAAAELIVQGESDLTLAGRFLGGGSLRREDVSYPTQRYTILLPAVKALVYATAASVVLDGLTADAGEPLVDTQALEADIQARGGVGKGWQIASHGPFHDLARHIRIYVTTRPNATLEDLEGSIGLLDSSFKGPRDPAGAVLASARLDGAWWVARAAQEGTNELWKLTITFLNSRASGAIYEQTLLANAMESGTSWGVWALAGGAAVAVVALAVALWRRGRRGRARSTATLLVVALLAFTPAVLPVSAHGDNGHPQGPNGPPAPVLPLPKEPVAFTSPMHAAYGGLAQGPDGILHFAWVGCPGAPAKGCYNVYHRTLDPATGEWSPPQMVADPPENATMARVAVAGDEVHIAWVQGVGQDSGEPLEFAHCLLRPFPCTSATRLSTMGEFTSGAEIVGRGNRLFAVWSEEDATTSLSKVYARWWQGGAWGTPFVLSDPLRIGRYPDPAIDSNGVAHVVWTGSVSNQLSTTRVLDYAAVAPEGVVDGPRTLAATPLDYRARPTIDVQEDGTVGVVYNGVRDVFILERPAGGTDWTAAVNVSHTQRLSQSWPILNSNGKDWIVSWVTGTIGQFHMWQAHRDDGFWLRPEIVLGSPYDGILFLPQALVADGQLHVIWTANATEAFDMQMLYDAWPADITASTPPEVWDVAPHDGSWVAGPNVPLVALIASAAPVTQEGARWEVDGSALPTTVDAEGRVHATANLTDGPHMALLRVEDTKGGRTEERIVFLVDATAPEFTTTVRVGDRVVANATGWQDAPVTVEANATEDEGSPVHVQVDYNGVGLWRDLTAPIQVPEGYLVALRLRSMDDADNIRLGSPMTIGWDATAPNLAVEVPRWSNGAVTPIPVKQGDSGSPVTVEVAVRGPNGETASTAQQPLASLQLPALPEGSYSVHLKATDAVGHTQDVGTWDLGVDRQAPTVSLQSGSVRLQDRGASGLANVTFLRSGENASPVQLEGKEATLAGNQLPAGVSRLELLVRDRAGNQWHGTVDLATGEVKEIVLDVNGSETTAKRSPTPEVALLAVALLALVALRRKRDD